MKSFGGRTIPKKKKFLGHFCRSGTSGGPTQTPVTPEGDLLKHKFGGGGRGGDGEGKNMGRKGLLEDLRWGPLWDSARGAGSARRDGTFGTLERVQGPENPLSREGMGWAQNPLSGAGTIFTPCTSQPTTKHANPPTWEDRPDPNRGGESRLKAGCVLGWRARTAITKHKEGPHGSGKRTSAGAAPDFGSH